MDGDLFFLQPKHSSMMRELVPAANNAVSVARAQNTMAQDTVCLVVPHIGGGVLVLF